MKSEKGYAELHCHSNFSLLDGASHPEDLVSKAADLGMPALALTDHDGVYGAIRFYKACLKAGIRPIIGAEMTLQDGGHLTLLARNNEGYSNLCRLITGAQLEQEHRGAHPQPPRGNPVLKLEVLARHSAGLICLSGCRKGEIVGAIKSGSREKACKVAGRYIEIFGREDFYIELQNSFYPEDMHLCRILVDLAGSLKPGYVATNNVHYADRKDHRLHDVLACIKTRTTLDEC
ncbi:MAG: PHP domain-containing protein, partial [Dehalococcoidia bacterium]